MEMVVYVTPELGWTMKPRTNSNEYAPGKPLRTIVASGGAGIRRNVIVTIGTVGGRSDLDGYLSLCFWGARRDPYSNGCGAQYKCKSSHKIHLPIA